MGNAQRKAAHRSSRGLYAPSSPAKKVHWDGPGLPAPPGKPVLVPGEEDSQPDVVGIRWERSPSSGGSAIIGYHVEHRKMGSPHWVRSAPVLCTFPELTLSGLEPGWRYQFRIRAQNALGLSEPSELSDPLTVTLQRTATLAPRFEHELADCLAREGEQAEFTVMYMGTPLPKISWYKDGFEIFSSRRTTIATDSIRSVLIIQRTSIDDEGEIKCSATNRAGHISTRARLIIEAPPHVRLPRQYEEGLLFEQGETIRLKATNGGRPPPSITWYHNGEIIIVDERHNFESITDNETILKIQDAKRRDRGEYSIRAINKLGEDVASFLVTVTDRPAAPGKAVVSCTLGRSLTLSWNAPDDDGGCRIGTYIVEYYRLGWDVWLKAATSRQTTATLNELIEGSEYRFRVKAENPYGLSDPSEESDVVFIPDPKRGIIEPNMRAKSVSHRDIPRGRSERREISFHEPTQRTRSLTREEASNREAVNAYERTASTQRLAAAPVRPARADSRVTFALNTTSRDKDEPRRQWSKELLPQPGELEIVGRSIPPQMAVVVTPSFSDSSGVRSHLDSRARSVSYSREQSPSPIVLEEETEAAIKGSVKDMNLRSQLSPPRAPRRRRSSSEIRETTASLRSLHKEDEERMLHDSSEFMLVLYPNEEDGKQHEAQRLEKQSEVERCDSHTASGVKSQVENRIAVEVCANSEEEDLLPPPPLSHSLPELFSLEHQIIEIFREAVSSTELLHERAMERFYRAVEAENSVTSNTERAKYQPPDSESFTKRAGDSENYALFNTRIRQPVRRRLSNSSCAAWQMRRDRRRSSEGQAKASLSIKGSVLTVLGLLENATSDPNLAASNELLAQKKVEPWIVGDFGGSAERLRRWHETGIYLSNEDSIAQMIDKENHQNKENEEILKVPELLIVPEINIKESSRMEEEYDEVAPDTGVILAENSIESSYVSSEEESTDSEDLKQLKARIMAIPVTNEDATYHPRGRMILQTELESPPPVPPHRVPTIDISPPVPDRINLSPTNLTPVSSNNTIVPKSILKKRTDTDPVAVNQFGRPIPPENPIPKTRSAGDNDEQSALSNRPLSNLDNTDIISGIEGRIDIATPQSSHTPKSKSTVSNTANVDHDEEAVISAGEAAVSKRKQIRQGSKAISTEDNELEQEETLAVVNHYTEIVRQCSRSDFRQRSLSQDRETKRYESPSESRVASPVQNQLPPPNTHKERLPVTPGKIITPISPAVPLKHAVAKIITPIPPVIPTTIIQKAKPIEYSRRGSFTNRMHVIEPEAIPALREKSMNQDLINETRTIRTNNIENSRSSTPTGRRSESRPTSRNESRSDSRCESPIHRSRNISRDRESSMVGSRSSSTTRCSETRSSISSARRNSRPSSRASSRDRSRASTPTEAKIERLQRALDDKNERMRRVSTNDRIRGLEEKRKIRSTFSYFTDVCLLLAAFYVYLFKKEVLAIPFIVLLMFRYTQEEISNWIPARWRHQNQRR